jgi:hypothetical protein
MLSEPSCPKRVGTPDGSGSFALMCLNVSAFFAKSTEYGRRRDE